MEGDETVVVTLAAGTGYTVGSPSAATVTISDDDATVTVTATRMRRRESRPGTGPGTGAFTFTRAGYTAGALTVNYTVGGTATSGTDYAALGTTVDFLAGATTATKTVSVLDDNLVEGNETVEVTLAAGTGYTVGSPSAAIVTIKDDATVTGRRVFYNHSAWDGNDSAANANDDNAIAPDKTALLPGGTATFANYTSYSRGLNGIMVDIAGLRGTPTVSDFTFKVGNDNSPAGWSTAPDPVSITVRAGAGTNGSDRVTLIWNDNNLDGVVDANEAVAKKWLEVTVKATANTGLAADDVFYFGNAVGESGNSVTEAEVSVLDAFAVVNHLVRSSRSH